MNLDYYYLSEEEPTTRKKRHTVIGKHILKGMREIRKHTIVSRLILQDSIKPGGRADNRDFHMAISLDDLAALVKDAQRDYPFDSKIRMRLLSYCRQSSSSWCSSAQSSLPLQSG